MRDIASKFEETIWGEARSYTDYNEIVQRRLSRVDSAPPLGKENGAAPSAHPQHGGETHQAPHRRPPAHHHRQQQSLKHEEPPQPQPQPQPQPPPPQQPPPPPPPQQQQQQQQQRYAPRLPSPGWSLASSSFAALHQPPAAFAAHGARAATSAPAAARSPRDRVNADGVPRQAPPHPPHPPPPPPPPPPALTMGDRPPNAAQQYWQLTARLRTGEWAESRRYIEEVLKALRRHEKSGGAQAAARGGAQAHGALPEVARKAADLRTSIAEYLERMRDRPGDSSRSPGVADIMRLNELHRVICKEVLGKVLGRGKAAAPASAAAPVGTVSPAVAEADAEADCDRLCAVAAAAAAAAAGGSGASPGGAASGIAAGGRSSTVGGGGGGATSSLSSLARVPKRSAIDARLLRSPVEMTTPLLARLAHALDGAPAVSIRRQPYATALARVGGSEGGMHIDGAASGPPAKLRRVGEPPARSTPPTVPGAGSAR